MFCKQSGHSDTKFWHVTRDTDNICDVHTWNKNVFVSYWQSSPTQRHCELPVACIVITQGHREFRVSNVGLLDLLESLVRKRALELLRYSAFFVWSRDLRKRVNMSAVMLRVRKCDSLPCSLRWYRWQRPFVRDKVHANSRESKEK